MALKVSNKDRVKPKIITEEIDSSDVFKASVFNKSVEEPIQLDAFEVFDEEDIQISLSPKRDFILGINSMIVALVVITLFLKFL